MAYLAVGVGSALGGVGRFWIAGLVGRRFGDSFPWGTVLVNCTGSFAIGVMAALASAEGRLHPRINPLAAQFLMVGICGGFTTFSSFSLQTLRLIQAGSVSQAGANIALSVIVCLLAVWAGYAVCQLFQRP